MFDLAILARECVPLQAAAGRLSLLVIARMVTSAVARFYPDHPGRLTMEDHTVLVPGRKPLAPSLEPRTRVDSRAQPFHQFRIEM